MYVLFQLVIGQLLLVFGFVNARGDDGDAVQQHDREGERNDPGLATYVSRPDLYSPKWTLTIHDTSAPLSGYWFAAPYRGINGEQSNESFIGPFIYDGRNGELIWSGGLMFSTKHSNVEDFRVSNINGEMLMTMFAQDQVVVLNNDYSIRTSKSLETQGYLNTHELQLVDEGRRAIVLMNDVRIVFAKDLPNVVGTKSPRKQCSVQFDGFFEVDVTRKNWPRTFEWHSFGNILLDESTLPAGPVETRCEKWDFLHANSVDKTPEGDYLFSARHTDSIYKISGSTGLIIWRLGGRRSDFTISSNTVFSRQHNVRYRGKNSTHAFISILDNAKGQDDQANTHAFSRGLLIALDEKNMRASVEAQFDHPYHALANRRGNYQRLKNGNVLMGWSERALQSEHTADGKLIWDAILQVDWLGTYRSYKFDHFIGRPTEPPVAVSRAFSDRQGTTTIVHVSWNGVTEVGSWRVHKTSPDGETLRLLVASASKDSFETELRLDGYANFVVVEAIDKDGRSIGNTSVVQTVAIAAISASVLAAEEQWLQQALIDNVESVHVRRQPSKMVQAFCAGTICGAVLLLALRHTRQRRNGFLRYYYRPAGSKYAASPG